jgi:tRNA(adenine34) deaminase
VERVPWAEGGVRERPNRHAWKACEVQASVGSNPTPSAMSISYEDAMSAALIEAQHAMDDGDVPVGAVVLHNGQIIAAARNEREKLQDPSAHAEVLALRMAAKKLSRWRLDDCDLVVTLEPCVMCAGAILNARIRRLIFGALEPKTGATSSLYNVCSDPRLNHEMVVVSGVRSREASELLQRFFGERRDSTASSAR